MSEALILEFKNVTPEDYAAVNKLLGINSETGEGDWPAGLTSHTGAASGDELLVFEVWESQGAQEEFMSSRLGPALGQAGLPAPSRSEWMTVLGHHAG